MDWMLVVWIAVFAVCLLVLFKSADWLTEGAEEVGLFFGVPVYVVGLTIVAIGTSLPELASAVVSVIRGSPEIVPGNVVGANITNVFWVLAVSAIVGGRLFMSHDIVRLDIPILTISAALLGLTAFDGTISRIEGALLFILVVMHFTCAVRAHRPSPAVRAELEAAIEEDIHVRRGRLRPIAVVKIVVGGAGLVLAADYLIRSVVELSAILGIGTDVIAITVMSVGTTLPEFAVSVLASHRGKYEIAIGNVLGSCIFNVSAVAGTAALVAPLPVTDAVLTIGLPFLAAATLLFVFSVQDREVTRWEGMMLLLLYPLFIGTLFGLL